MSNKNITNKKTNKKNSVENEFNQALSTTAKNNTISINDIFQKAGSKTSNKKTSNKKTSNKKTSNKKNETEIVFKKNGYTRPDITFTDQLSKEQIEEKLEDYKKVDDIFKVPLGVHLRYFSNIDGKMVFRMGGQLHKNNGLPAYVMLSNGKNQWSVQVKDTLFYRKMVLSEIKEEYQKIIDELIIKNKKLKQKLKEYEK